MDSETPTNTDNAESLITSDDADARRFGFYLLGVKHALFGLSGLGAPDAGTGSRFVYDLGFNAITDSRYTAGV